MAELQKRHVLKMPSGVIVRSKKHQYLESLRKIQFPKSYTSNSSKEETILEYVEDFRRQFVQLFPHRRALFLCPLNECGVRKFVCSTIRPANLPYTDIYGLQDCSSFVADFLDYIPLDEPTKPPEYLPSTATILRLRRGDCFDYSTFLCSLLRGAGFNAYCVSGYAPQWITHRDQSMTDPPAKFLADDPIPPSPTLRLGSPPPALPSQSQPPAAAAAAAPTAAPAAAQTAPATADAPAVPRQRYKILEPPSHISKYRAAREAEAQQKQTQEQQEQAMKQAADTLASAGLEPTAAAAAAAAPSTMGLASSSSNATRSSTVTTSTAGAGLKCGPMTQDEIAAAKALDPLHGDRVHSWILVLKGRRDVPFDCFIEPTTGAMWPVHASPYTGIESVWNEHNYWVNVQDCYPWEMSYDLTKTTQWEYILIDDKLPTGMSADSSSSGSSGSSSNPAGGAAAAGGASSSGSATSTGTSTSSSAASSSSAAPGASSSSSSAAAGGGGGGSSQTAGGSSSGNPDEGKDGGFSDDIFDDREILDAPTSWCAEIAIDRETFRQRFPEGARTVIYRRCFVDHVAPYYEGMQGLVTRVMLYDDDGCLGPTRQLREFFQYRNDKLIKRVTYIQENKKHEVYAPGKISGLKDLIEEDDKRRISTFYPHARVDGLAYREEIFGKKIIELFEGRDDRLTYRSVAFDPPGTPGRVSRFELTVKGFGPLPVRKVTEKYARNLSIPSETDVRKRTHLLAESAVRLDYHYGPAYITSSRVTIDKDEKDSLEADVESEHGERRRAKGEEVRVDAAWKPPTRAEQKEQLDALFQKEKELLARVREHEAQCTELMSKAEEDKKNVKLEKTYDLAQEQMNDSERDRKDGEEEGDRVSIDYLTPFLAQYPPNKPLTERQAQQAKEDCLATLKERLLERANIIQAHLDDELQKLHQKQATYKRQAGAGSAEADEEFSRYYEQAAFRIDILRARLNKHEEQAVKKYIELDAKLNSDPRLAILRRRAGGGDGGY